MANPPSTLLTLASCFLSAVSRSCIQAVFFCQMIVLLCKLHFSRLLSSFQEPPVHRSVVGRVQSSRKTRRAFPPKNFVWISPGKFIASTCWTHFSQDSCGKLVPKRTLSCP